MPQVGGMNCSTGRKKNQLSEPLSLDTKLLAREQIFIPQTSLFSDRLCKQSQITYLTQAAPIIQIIQIQ